MRAVLAHFELNARPYILTEIRRAHPQLIRPHRQRKVIRAGIGGGLNLCKAGIRADRLHHRACNHAARRIGNLAFQRRVGTLRINRYTHEQQQQEPSLH